ncbi:MAG TPA: aminopeptidase [Gaiellaceae bacterium]|jgi:aminopeptidase
MSGNPRIEQYAKLLVETCIDVQPGWQVIVSGGVLGRPLLEEVSRQVGRRGAYALLRPNLTGSGLNVPWALEAPEELLSTPPEIDTFLWANADALISIEAPENTRELTGMPQERLAMLQAGLRPHLERVLTMDLKWVGCQYPTPALAQEAEMSLREFADFLYGACLLDWTAERERMSRYAERFDAAEEVRIVGDGTDLRLGVEGRPMYVDAGGANMPGGEFFTSPVEDTAEGEIVFAEFPAVYAGREVRGIRLRFEGGKVVDASAEANEAFLFEQLDLDDGSRKLGELGIGCNPGITRHMKNTLFDEKIDGTVHLAVGNGLPEVGGENVSQLHWDIVKDMRSEGSRIELDGEVVQEAGSWRI